MKDAPLPNTTQALLDHLQALAGAGITSPETWRQLGVTITQHAAWLEEYVEKTAGPRPPVLDWSDDDAPAPGPRVLMLLLLAPILEQLRPFAHHLDGDAKGLIAEAEQHGLFDPTGPSS